MRSFQFLIYCYSCCCVSICTAFQGLASIPSLTKQTTSSVVHTTTKHLSPYPSNNLKKTLWGCAITTITITPFSTVLNSSPTSISEDLVDTENFDEEDDDEDDDDLVIHIKPKAMTRLRELKSKQEDENAPLILRMGVRNGGCSGLSYVMDFSTEEEIEADDLVDEYEDDGDKLWLKCVVDAKSMLYLYGLELDFSEDLIGGGFKFFNPNAEESCGCGSSFGV